MNLDWAGILSGAAAVLGAVSALWIGVIKGRSEREKDHTAQQIELERARSARDTSLEKAAASRINSLTTDLERNQRQAAELTNRHDKALRISRINGQRGWDLARFYYNLASSLNSQLQRIIDASGDSHPHLVETIKSVADKVSRMNFPMTLEEPIPETAAERGEND